MTNAQRGITENELNQLEVLFSKAYDTGLAYLKTGRSIDQIDENYGNPKRTTNTVMRYMGMYGKSGTRFHGPTLVKHYLQNNPNANIDRLWDEYINLVVTLRVERIEDNRYMAEQTFPEFLENQLFADPVNFTQMESTHTPQNRKVEVQPESAKQSTEMMVLYAVLGVIAIIIAIFLIKFILGHVGTVIIIAIVTGIIIFLFKKGGR